MPVLKQLEKDVLSDLLGKRDVVKEIPRDAVDHCLVLSHDHIEVTFSDRHYLFSGLSPASAVLIRIRGGF
jgi:hypothetical protein